ncbi:MAG: hypothetical protein VYC17_05380 [Nitrospinota bacterium]|nr:hypothetical protein [Nitrospinota bacterium]
MATLKGMLFNQFAGEGFNSLVEDLQQKYKPKKGRRFNHQNVTYEIGWPILKNSAIEFEISCKIPQDEIKNPTGMKAYFTDIKKILNKSKTKPLSIEMENIVWDSKKDTEKERDYVKLLYQYPLDQFFDEKEIMKRHEQFTKGTCKELLPNVPGIFTAQGKLALVVVQETAKKICQKHIDGLINANKQVRS